MNTLRRPEWLKKKIEFDSSRQTSKLLDSLNLNTVCREAKCPNISECFKNQNATFLILGSSCSRHCRFCHVDKTPPQPVDTDEPYRVAQAVLKLRLKHVVVTSVTRDDLPDGGAFLFAQTIKEIKRLSEKITIELLIPDLQGNTSSLQTITKCLPHIIGHNIETVPSLYHLRPEADYQTSLNVLKAAKTLAPAIHTKSALMLGLGEKKEEVISVMEDLRKVDCDFLALGQYLRPSLKNVEVRAYIEPQRFEEYRNLALDLGFKHIESSPYVRSSYRARGYLTRLR